MHLNIFNKELVSQIEPTFGLSFDDIYEGYIRLFKEYELGDINIVFVEKEYIQELNSKYREIDAPTDVISFKVSEKPKVGEIYICPEYIYDSFQEELFEDEILRLIIHGTLHILGYEHEESLNDSPNEEMFVVQENLLLKYKKICS
jgi:probable rRNA maturation factor